MYNNNNGALGLWLSVIQTPMAEHVDFTIKLKCMYVKASYKTEQWKILYT